MGFPEGKNDWLKIFGFVGIVIEWIKVTFLTGDDSE